MSAASQNEMERLRRERDSRRGAYDVISEGYQRVTDERDALERMSEQYKREAYALAAHVVRLSDAVCKEGAGPMARAVIDSAPVDSLARLKAEWQAKALEAVLDDSDDTSVWATLRNRIKELRRQAEGGRS